MPALVDALGGDWYAPEHVLGHIRNAVLSARFKVFHPENQLMHITAMRSLHTLTLLAEPMQRFMAYPPLSRLPALETFHLLSRLPCLTSLSLLGMCFCMDGAVIDQASRGPLATQLRTLKLSNVSISRVDIERLSRDHPLGIPFRRFKFLEQLEVTSALSASLSKFSLQWLPDSLKRLSLTGFEMLPPSRKLEPLPHLLSISLRACQSIQDAGMGPPERVAAFQLERCPNLEVLSDDNCRLEEDGSMHISALQPPICPTSSRLTTLRLDFRLPSSLPPEVVLQQFERVSQLSELRSLSLHAYCRPVGETYQRLHEGVEFLSRLRYLRHLHLAPVSAASVTSIAKLTGLATLELFCAPAYALLELSSLKALRLLRYSEDVRREKFDPFYIRMDPMALAHGLASSLPHARIVHMRPPSFPY